MDNLASGLLGALVGAAIGVFGAFFIERRRDRRDDRAAARATYMEVGANIPRLSVVRLGGSQLPLSQSTWQGSRLRLAHTLDPNEFVRVSRYYANIEAMNASGSPDGSATMALRAIAELLEAQSDEILPILQRQGWSEAEAKNMA